MNEEEKQAIFEIEKLTAEIYTYMGIEKVRFYHDKYKTILNLIEKQQKENEKLKKQLKEERAFNKSALETLKECVHKDKIREKIKKYNSLLYSFEERDKLGDRADIGSVNSLLAQIAILNSLLGE